MNKTDINIIPNCTNSSPDYYCTWQTQLFATCDGKPAGQRAIIGEKALFSKEKPHGWAYFYEPVRKDLLFVMDDSWDVPFVDDPTYYGSLILNNEKFPEAVNSSKTNAEALKNLSGKIKALGWKGLGGWVCAQESKKFQNNDTPEEYWTKKVKEANESDFEYWKVDWGEKAKDINFRIMQTELARKYAPNLIIEHALVKDIIPDSDVFRTYDVPAIMSIPLTMQKLDDILRNTSEKRNGMGLIDCEDEVYIAAAGGFTMGVMRHPYVGAFPNGNKDMSFPEVHRNLKTKIYEVIRAARWHRLAPAFGVDDNSYVDDNILTDSWKIVDKSEEFEAWWFDIPWFSENINNGVVEMSGTSQIARGCKPAIAEPNPNGLIPYIVASKNPNGVFSVATLGRTHGRKYEIPLCRINIFTGTADTIGVFGEYKELIINTDNKDFDTILIQDIASDISYDVSENIQITADKLIIPGELIHKIGTMAQPEKDTSEPGVVIKLILRNKKV